ncbi:MAG: hypothetical protein ACRDKG_01815 [Actinomycetota bacterium]
MPETPASTVEDVTDVAPDTADEIVEDASPAEVPAPAAPAARRTRAWLAPQSVAPIYLGITLTIAGFALLAFTWSRVAGTAIVALQLPYIASGGFVGLGLVVIGIVAINLGAKRRDAWQRDRRLEELAAILEGRTSAPDEDPSA